jgi:nucleoside-diphosphate-sugar epimerase
MKNKILITGGTGFIGSNIANYLLTKKFNVVLFDNNSRGSLKNIDLKNKRISFIKGDIRNFNEVLKACNNIRTVIHCAAINGTKNFYEKPDQVLEVGVKGIFNIIDSCKIKKIKNVFIASSSEVYHYPDKIPTKETTEIKIPDITNLRYSYSGSKILSELAGFIYGKNFFRKMIIFRPHNVYGPKMGMDHVIPELIHKVKNKKKIKLQGSGKETRSFIYIDDFIKAFDLIFNKGKTMNIYNIGTEERIMIKILLKKIFKICKIKKKIKHISRPSGGTPHRCPDITKIKKLGFKHNISIDEGLKKYIKNEYAI